MIVGGEGADGEYFSHRYLLVFSGSLYQSFSEQDPGASETWGIKVTKSEG